jgi:hypothetical protein
MVQTRKPILTGLILCEWPSLTHTIITHVLEVIMVLQSRGHIETNRFVLDEYFE